MVQVLLYGKLLYDCFFGNVEDLAKIRSILNENAPKALFIVVVTEALSMGLLTPPGTFGVDVVVGEGQSLGLAPSFGGPGIGLFSSKAKYLRKMPGRITGETVDKEQIWIDNNLEDYIGYFYTMHYLDIEPIYEIFGLGNYAYSESLFGSSTTYLDVEPLFPM